jgi:hypothetical protein
MRELVLVSRDALSRRKQGFESPRERHPSNCPLFLQAFLAKLSNCTESLTVDVRYLAFSIADNASFF